MLVPKVKNESPCSNFTRCECPFLPFPPSLSSSSLPFLSFLSVVNHQRESTVEMTGTHLTCPLHKAFFNATKMSTNCSVE